MRRPVIRRAHVRCPKAALSAERMTGVTNGSTIHQGTSETSFGALTVGLDLSDKFSSLCFLDDSGEVIEEARVRTSQTALAQRFGALQPSPVILEVGTHSPWVSRLIDELGHEVIAANPGRCSSHC